MHVPQMAFQVLSLCFESNHFSQKVTERGQRKKRNCSCPRGILANYMSALKPTADHQPDLQFFYRSSFLVVSNSLVPNSDRPILVQTKGSSPVYTSLKSFTLPSYLRVCLPNPSTAPSSHFPGLAPFFRFNLSDLDLQERKGGGRKITRWNWINYNLESLETYPQKPYKYILIFILN